MKENETGTGINGPTPIQSAPHHSSLSTHHSSLITHHSLEVLVCTVADARAAAAGGASRLEVVREAAMGGLSPALATVAAIQAAVRLPLRVMVRPTPAFRVTAETVDAMAGEARALQRLGVEGIVLGMLCDIPGAEDSGAVTAVDLRALQRVLAAAPDLRATFHRACEELSDPVTALSELGSCPQVDRVLMSLSNGAGKWEEGVAKLARYATAAPALTWIVGGGLRRGELAPLARAAIAQGLALVFHVGTAAREPAKPEAKVSAAKVAALVEELSSSLSAPRE